jgi:hypothetical protein
LGEIKIGDGIIYPTTEILGVESIDLDDLK